MARRRNWSVRSGLRKFWQATAAATSISALRGASRTASSK